MATRRKDAFHFVQISDPHNSASWKRQVRSHAARNARARQQRVIQYQKDNTQVSRLHAKETPDDAANPVQPTYTYGPIFTALGAARTDPFHTFARKMTNFENFLLDYCTSSHSPLVFPR